MKLSLGLCDVNNVCRMCKVGGGGEVHTNRSRYDL